MVMPLYNEERNIPQVIPELVAEFEKEGVDYELVLVDNGSRDATGNLLAGLARENPRLKVVTVEVNQGYGWGIISGLRQAQGHYIGYMCADGQISPRDVVRVYQRLLEGDCDLAKVWRTERYDGALRRINSAIYNSIIDSVGVK